MSAAIHDRPATMPMTIIGGYLGAGKTTLVNEFLAATGGRRVAVVVNDFGSVNIDAALVRSRSEDTLELANGCVCCSLSDGMPAVMERLSAMAPRPDHVLVEVSGVGDPAAVAGWGDHPGFRRNGVLVCADVETVRDRAADRWVGDTVLKQLRAAGTLLLTKADLAGPSRTSEVRRWVADIAEGARIVGDRASVVAMLDQGFHPGSEPAAPSAGEADDHASNHTSWTVRGHGTVRAETLRNLLSGLPAEVVRVKGVVATTAAPDRWTVVHATGSRVDLGDGGPRATAGEPSTLVVIVSGPADREPGYLAELRRVLAAGTR
jgi:G3E family GTPase